MADYTNWTAPHLILYYIDRPTWNACVQGVGSKVWNDTDTFVRDPIDASLQDGHISMSVVDCLFDDGIPSVYAYEESP